MSRLTPYAALLPLALMLVVGCGQPQAEKTAEDKTGVPDTPPDTVDSDHAGHPTEGPNHGDLIELGNHEYHGELVHPEHGEKSAVTIYILDRSAEKQLPIDAKSVYINVTHDGKPEQFTLNANPDVGDQEGKSSRFTSSDTDLLEHFGEEEIEGRLVVKINGKSYNGKISHSHDHAGHDHAH